MNRPRYVFIFALLFLPKVAISQSPDFLHPQQRGPFQIDGLAYGEFAVTGPQSGYVDPVNLGGGFSVPTLDQIVAEIKATGTNLVKISLTLGQMKTPTDNAYDPSVAFPLEGTANNVIAFGQKLTACHCLNCNLAAPGLQLITKPR